MSRIKFAIFLFANLVLATSACAQGSQAASADDTARFLAGMQVSAGSPLEKTQDWTLKPHAYLFDTAFGKLEEQQLSKVRAWSSANLNPSRQMMYYLFSGPDFLYANAFFPHASTYIFAGLEPVGQIPDLTKFPRSTIVQTLRNIEVSLSSILSVSYFITVNMRSDLNNGPVFGALPILYVFLARSGKTIREMSLVNLDDQGGLQQGEGLREKSTARGVKIIFAGDDGQAKTLYYFSTSIADEPNGKYAFLKFCKQHSQGDSFLKSASYLLHRASFSMARNFLLEQSSLILQDDSGIPVANFEIGKWFLYPFGRYTTPLNIFQEHYQPKLTELYQRKQPNPIDFGIGYSARFDGSNLLLAIKNPGARDLMSVGPMDAVPRHFGSDQIGILEKPRFPDRPSRLGIQDKREIY
jgi:hypothetical protein